MKSPRDARTSFTEGFAEFENSPSLAVHAALTAQIRAEVIKDFSPSFVSVFTKVFGIHFLAAIGTLSICPQFGFKLGADDMGIMHYFMNLGPIGCRVACGFFFMALSLGLSAALLRAPEVRVLRAKWWLESFFLILVSMGFFIMVANEEIIGLLAAGWVFGGMLGSWIALESVWRLRLLAVAR